MFQAALPLADWQVQADMRTRLIHRPARDIIPPLDHNPLAMRDDRCAPRHDQTTVRGAREIDWMDYGTQHKLIKDDTRVNLLGNRLVLIAPKDSKIGNVTIAPGFDLAKLAGDGRIVTGDVRAVPVGKYAKAALEKLGAWAAAEPKFAMTENVRAALTLVARGEAALGIVYETDAKVEPNVKIVGAFPADSHPPIVYPVALTVNAKPEAAQYLTFLRSPAAKAVFEAYGFTFLVKPTS
jgi:molybdate transport system substrate-binding protein